MAARPPACDFGWKAGDFKLPSTGGTDMSLANVAGERGTVIVFICNHCPYVIGVTDRLVQEAAALKELGVGFAAICSNDAETYPDDSFPNMIRFAERNRFNFPYLHDPDQSVARAYGAECTPDFFGFNSALELQYRGRLDSAGPRARDADARRELYEAMKEVADTGRGPSGQTPSMGCSIKWKRAA